MVGTNQTSITDKVLDTGEGMAVKKLLFDGVLPCTRCEGHKKENTLQICRLNIFHENSGELNDRTLQTNSFL